MTAITATFWQINRLLSLLPFLIVFSHCNCADSWHLNGVLIMRIVWRQLEKTTCFECTALTGVTDLHFFLLLLPILLFILSPFSVSSFISPYKPEFSPLDTAWMHEPLMKHPFPLLFSFTSFLLFPFLPRYPLIFTYLYQPLKLMTIRPNV